MLQTKGLEFRYPNSGPHLQFPDLHCGKGEQWLLLGQSGTGKTTMLQLLAGLRTPTAGSVQVNDTALEKLSHRVLDQFRGKHIGIVFQQSHFVRSLSVRENLMLAQQLAGESVQESRIKELLEQLNLGHKLHAAPLALSVGEQQRVAIARALINRPSVLLADEPTSALDDHNTEQVVQLLRKQAEAANATLLVVTHDNRLKSIFDQHIEL